MSRETETACFAASDCRLDPNCADYGYQCAATAAREAEIRAQAADAVLDEVRAGLDDLERRGIWGADVSPADVADLIARVRARHAKAATT